MYSQSYAGGGGGGRAFDGVRLCCSTNFSRRSVWPFICYKAIG
ncbi:hypothetical protein O9929_09940 [Vibrio lentus]|nr:hypothetical protein [Vibrio lentus]